MYAAAAGAALSAFGVGGSGGLTGGSSNPKAMTAHSDVIGNSWSFGDFIYKGSGGTQQASFGNEFLIVGVAVVAVVGILAFSKR